MTQKLKNLESDISRLKTTKPTISKNSENSDSDATLRSEVQDFLNAITEESNRFETELKSFEETNKTIFEKMSSLEDGLQYQYQEFAKFRLDFNKAPKSIDTIPKEEVMSMMDYTDMDSSEAPPGILYSSLLYIMVLN